MATIKLQDGKVILKENKASCSCCVTDCLGNFKITDANVFQITKERYDLYRKGGVWNLTADFDINVFGIYDDPFSTILDQTQTVVGSGELIGSIADNGECEITGSVNKDGGNLSIITTDVSNQGTRTQEITFLLPFPSYTGAGIRFIRRLKKDGNKYYINFLYAVFFNWRYLTGVGALTFRRERNIESGFAGYLSPTTNYSANIDGNPLERDEKEFVPFTIYTPLGIKAFTTYNETSSIELNATFTPA